MHYPLVAIPLVSIPLVAIPLVAILLNQHPLPAFDSAGNYLNQALNFSVKP
jgi:hypothetical protein